MGFSLNLVSLLALTLVTGILVDDAIVEIENIVRHMRMGKSPYRAALEAADEIGLAVIAITFTIVAVFAPVSFMGGIAGQYFKQFGVTVAAAVLISLLVARLITPMLAAYFMRAARTRGRARRRHHARVYAARRLVGPAQVHHVRARARPVRRIDLVDQAAALRVPARRRHLALALRRRAAARLVPWKIPKSATVLSTGSARCPKSRSVFVNGGVQLPGKKEVPPATLTVNYVPKEERKLPPASA